jgi:organic radical activating enzyme
MMSKIVDFDEVPLPQKYEETLNVSEIFYETIQGEGPTAGEPAIFLRLGGCHLNCKGCDTSSVWGRHRKIGVEELLNIVQELLKVTQGCYRLVVTGGSPLLQQDNLVPFLRKLKHRQSDVAVELENEATIMPDEELIYLVDQINNSPKLSFWGILKNKRFFPEVLRRLSKSYKSNFKFVIRNEGDYREVLDDFLYAKLILKRQIILMPYGATRDELCKHREEVITIASKNNVRYSDRLQIVAWDDKKSV